MFLHIMKEMKTKGGRKKKAAKKKKILGSWSVKIMLLISKRKFFFDMKSLNMDSTMNFQLSTMCTSTQQF